jgi:hypothetical protein
VTNEPIPDPTAATPVRPGGENSVEDNKADSRHWIDVFNERDNAAAADVLGSAYVAHAPASLEPAPLDSEAWAGESPSTG